MSSLSPAIERFKERLLAPEREDAQKRLADRDYWGDTGLWVLRAIVAVDGAINAVSPCSPSARDCPCTAEKAGECVSAWIDQVIVKMEAAHERFRQEEDDPDGYGSATFHACLRRVQQFRDELPLAG